MGKLTNENLFENESDSQQSVEQRTLAQAVGSTLYSREFAWKNFFESSQSLINLLTEMSGNAGDTIDAWLEFSYNDNGGSLSWIEEAIKIMNGVAANKSVTALRLDSLQNFRSYIPFEEVRVKFEKASGANASCPIKGRLLIL